MISALDITYHKIRLHREGKLDQYLLELKFFVFSKNAKLSFLDMNSVTTWKIMIYEILKNLIFEKIFENFELFVKNHVIWLSSSLAHFWDNLRLFAFLGLEVQIELAPFVIIRDESYHGSSMELSVMARHGAKWRVRVSFTNNHERSCKYFWSCFYKSRIWFTNYT